MDRRTKNEKYSGSNIRSIQMSQIMCMSLWTVIVILSATFTINILFMFLKVSIYLLVIHLFFMVTIITLGCGGMLKYCEHNQPNDDRSAP